MARIRRYKPEIWTHERFGELATLARLLYLGLGHLADSWGVLEYRPKYIKASLFPYDDMTAATLATTLVEIERVGLIRILEHQGRKLIAIKHFRKHQAPGMQKEERNRLPQFGLKESQIDWDCDTRQGGTNVVASAEDWKTGRLEDWKIGRSEDPNTGPEGPPDGAAPAAPTATPLDAAMQAIEDEPDETTLPDTFPHTEPEYLARRMLADEATPTSQIKGSTADKRQVLAEVIHRYGEVLVRQALTEHEGSLWASDLHDLLADYRPPAEYTTLPMDDDA